VRKESLREAILVAYLDIPALLYLHVGSPWLGDVSLMHELSIFIVAKF